MVRPITGLVKGVPCICQAWDAPKPDGLRLGECFAQLGQTARDGFPHRIGTGRLACAGLVGGDLGEPVAVEHMQLDVLALRRSQRTQQFDHREVGLDLLGEVRIVRGEVIRAQPATLVVITVAGLVDGDVGAAAIVQLAVLGVHVVEVGASPLRTRSRVAQLGTQFFAVGQVRDG